MPRRPAGLERPADAVPPDQWLEGPYADDPGVRYVQQAARALAGWLDIEGESLRGLARHSRVSPMTIRALVTGARYPDLRTIALLETTQGMPLLLPFHYRVPGTSYDEDDI